MRSNKAIIKESFSDAEKHCGALLVTPKNFKSVKSWKGLEVSGLKYYVEKAISLGATKPIPLEIKTKPKA